MIDDDLENWSDLAVVASRDLVDRIRPLLAHQLPEVVGAALGELVAILLAGHHPSDRERARALLIDCIDDLVPVMVEEMIEDGCAPDDWRETRQ